MRKRAKFFLIVGAVLAHQVLFPFATPADGAERVSYAGEDRWVPSLGFTSGVTIQEQQGSALSLLFTGIGPNPAKSFLRCPNPPGCVVQGEDNVVSPFVGANLQVMTPALPIPTRPRFFVGGEIIPTFASRRALALEGDPGCIRGPEIDAPCARDEDASFFRRRPFGQDAANGEGTLTSAQIDTLVFGASAGLAFPLKIGDRQLLIKPYAAWIRYEVDAEGTVVNAACSPVERCTDVTVIPGLPPTPGFLRETIISGSQSQKFDGVGPGLDFEMVAGRYGQFGVSLFLGGGAYKILGDRTIAFDVTTPRRTDQIGRHFEVGQFEVSVASWMYRAHVGIRFQWLGSPD